MPTIKGFMAVSDSDFIDHDGRQVYIATTMGQAFRPVYLSYAAAERSAGDYQSVEPVELSVGGNDFFRFQHGQLRSEYTDYRHYRNALRRWKAAKHRYAQVLVMQQRTEVTDMITFADDKATLTETATDFEDRWPCNFVTFVER